MPFTEFNKLKLVLSNVESQASIQLQKRDEYIQMLKDEITEQKEKFNIDLEEQRL